MQSCSQSFSDINNKMKLTSDKEKRVRLGNYRARTNRAWRFANILSMSFETFETRVVMDNSPDRLSWKIQLSRDLSGWKMCYWLVFLALDQFFDCGNVIFSLQRLWPTASSSAFNRKMLSKVLYQFLLGNVLINLMDKCFTFPQIFHYSFIFVS